MNDTWCLIWRHELLETFHHFLRSFVPRWAALSPMTIKVLYHDLRDDAANGIRSLR